MRKSEHIEEERSNALVSDEGETCNLMASDYENQASLDIIPDVDPFPAVNLDSTFQGLLQEDEYDLPSIQPSALCTEQETSFQNSPFPSVNFGNETTEEEDNIHVLLNSLLADEDVFVSKERQHAFVHDSTPSELLRMGYYESSDTDAEVVSRYGNVLDTSTACNQNAGSREYRVMMVQTPHSAANSRQIASPVSVNLEQKVASRRPLQRKASSKEKSKDEDQKEASTVESAKDQRKAPGTSSGKNLGAGRDRSSGVNRYGSFIHLETPLLRQNPMPRSMYLLNVVVGFSLLIVTIWDLISSAKC